MHEIVLQAGPLQMVFVPDEGAVRWIHAGAHEVLRRISAPVRDAGWGTVPPRVEDLEIERGEQGFRVKFVARCRGGEIDFRWRGELTGAPDGVLEFTFDGEALADFARNRIGFCVLHPASLGGTLCAVEHVDGTVERMRFPEEIQPHQPAREIRALRHEVAPGLTAEVRMEGDTFEMEDQRNWTDASFKTYCTPLARPFPVVVEKGTRVRQRVTLHLHGDVPAAPIGSSLPWAPKKEATVTLVPGFPVPLPSLGVVWNAPAVTNEIVSALRSLALDHLRIDLVIADERCHDQLRTVAAAAAELGVALELAVWLAERPHAGLERLREELVRLAHSPRIARWLVFDLVRNCPEPGAIGVLRKVIAGTAFVAPVGGGAPGNFAELNRDRAVATAGDLTVHACNPQVHGSDDATLFETLSIQGQTVSAARRISGNRPACVSPVTLTRRWRKTDPGAPAFDGPTGCTTFQTDVRFGDSLVAAWTLGSLVSLHAAGAASVTFHEVVGPNGMLAEDGRLRPVATVFERLAGRHAVEEVIAEQRAEDGLAVLAFRRQSMRVIAVANLRPTARIVHILGVWGEREVAVAPYGTCWAEMGF